MTNHTVNELYERYAKPFEQDHYGEYIAVSGNGDTVLGPDLLKLSDEAHERFGPDHTIFKLGPKVAARWL